MIKEIVLNDKERKFMEATLAERGNAGVAFQEASSYLKVTNEEMWERLSKMFPQIKGGKANFNRNDHTLRYWEDEK